MAMENTINAKEKPLFIILLIFSIFAYLNMILSISRMLYVVFFLLFYWFSHIISMSTIRATGVKVSARQFPEINDMLIELCEKMDISHIPDTYILQSGGVLNAFATKVFSRQFIVIYSDILEMAYEQGEQGVKFVLAHELVHLKRKHVQYRWIVFPGMLVPFLGAAYSRACEYTCDKMAYFCCPDGAKNGLLALSVGKKLYSRVDLKEFLIQGEEERGFWVSFSELLSSHPFLISRLKVLNIYDM